MRSSCRAAWRPPPFRIEPFRSGWAAAAPGRPEPTDQRRERPVRRDPPFLAWGEFGLPLRADAQPRRIAAAWIGFGVYGDVVAECAPGVAARHRHRPGGRGAADQLTLGSGLGFAKNTEQNLALAAGLGGAAARRVPPCCWAHRANGSSEAVPNEPQAPSPDSVGHGGRLRPGDSRWGRMCCGCIDVGPIVQTARCIRCGSSAAFGARWIPSAGAFAKPDSRLTPWLQAATENQATTWRIPSFWAFTPSARPAAWELEPKHQINAAAAPASFARCGGTALQKLSAAQRLASTTVAILSRFTKKSVLSVPACGEHPR